MMNYFYALREYATPIKDKSTFYDTGRLTPEEFVRAGDFLVYKCPTWRWSAGDPRKSRSYLPRDKQYLITKNVPCMQRVEDKAEIFSEHNEGEWTVFEEPPSEIAVPVELDNGKNKGSRDEDDKNVKDVKNDEDVENVKDVENDKHDGNVSQETQNKMFEEDDDFYDAGQDEALAEDDVLKTRSYDVYITWDKYYQTPRVWLFGYDEHKLPLSQKEMFEDISAEHAKKTVTYEAHPHENYPCISIHPCKHDNVMKRLMAYRMGEMPKGTTRKAEIRVEQYMFLFLKFIGTVIPTISYDYSISM